MSETTMICLKVGGARSVVEVNEAEEILARFQNALTGDGEPVACETLDLSGRSWRLQSLHILEPIFRQVLPTLVNLNLEDIIASLQTEEGLAVFDYLATIFSDAPLLKWLNLNNNAIGTRGIERLRPLLANPSISTFLFFNDGLAAADAQTLRDLLTDPDIPREIHELNFYRNQMGTEGALHIGAILGHPHAMSLQAFSYAGCRPLREGTVYLCEGLLQLSENCGPLGTNLISLDLSDFGLGSGEEDDDPIFDICRVLRNSPRLQNLYIRDGELEVSGLERILNSLRESDVALQVLDLGVIGDLGTEGGDHLSDFFLSYGPTNRSLRELHLDTNCLGDEGLDLVLRGLSEGCESLQVLNLSENDLVNILPSLRQYPISTLRTLKLYDNFDLDASEELLELYEEVLVGDPPDDIEVEDRGKGANDVAVPEAAVDELADALGGSHI